MEIKYQLAPPDLEAAQAFAYRGTLLGWVLRRPLWAVGLAVVVVAAFLVDRQNPLATGSPILLFLAAFAFFWRRRYRDLQERGTAVFAPTTLVISAEAVESLATGRTSKTAWPQVQGFGETKDHVFVMLDGVSGHVIPKRQLSKHDIETLVGELTQHTQRLPDQPPSQRRVLLRYIGLWLVLVLVFFAWHVAQLRRAQ